MINYNIYKSGRGKMMQKSTVVFLSMIIFATGLMAQDSVDVTFYYKPTATPPATVYLPGEFNNWAENVGGVISNPAYQMTFDTEAGRWYKTVRLRVGGPLPLPRPGISVPGAYQYKINENGSSSGWLSDPLNPRRNPIDNNNSYLFINDPTIHYLLPNTLSGLVEVGQPEITAYIFPSTNTTVDTSSIVVTIDTVEYFNLGSFYDTETKQLVFTPPEPLSNGVHQLKLEAATADGSSSADSTEFNVQAGFVRFLTQPNDRHLRPTETVRGLVQEADIVVTMMFIGQDTVDVLADASGIFSYEFTLNEGINRFKAMAADSQQIQYVSDELEVTYFIDHSPRPDILLTPVGDNMQVLIDDNDPDFDAVSYLLTSDDEINPQPLNLSSTSQSFQFGLPEVPGEYYLDVVVTDAEENSGYGRTFFTVKSDSAIQVSTINSNPQWVRDAIVYEIYVPAFSDGGTLTQIENRLDELVDLGISVIWLMPIYQNGELINTLNAGYNITDFFTVHPQLGGNAAFESLLETAHSKGIRIILDSTPNHVSGSHPWVEDIELYRNDSNFRPFLETSILGDDRGLGQFRTRIDDYTLYVHYSNWSLANIDYQNIEAVDYMLDMYKYWLVDVGIDGYRMDVYWGPQNRYGANAFWRPFREEIKRVRPDVFILGETDGTGEGSEINYANGGGANDAAYDWSLYGQIKSVLSGGSINDLDNRVRNYSPNLNYNHYTGADAHYFRFMENHDEDRIASIRSLQATKAGAALLMTIPGIPLIYAGQEVGETSRRGQIDWGRSGAQDTRNYYRSLTIIRNTYETFRSSQIARVPASGSRVYAYRRPMMDQNAICAINFSGSALQSILTLSENDFMLSDTLKYETEYYLNDVLNDTSYIVTKSTLNEFTIQLPAWGSRVFIFADTLIQGVTSLPAVTNNTLPSEFELSQNFPNPFNPITTIAFTIPEQTDVTLKVYDLLGQEVQTVLQARRPAGQYQVTWDGTDNQGRAVGSGVYFYRLSTSSGQIESRKMILIR